MARILLALSGLTARAMRSCSGAALSSSSSSSSWAAPADSAPTAAAVALPSTRKLKLSAAAALLLGLLVAAPGVSSDADAADKMLQGSMIAPVGTTGFGTGVNEGNTNMIAMIRERGVVNIGVKADIKGLGLRDANGQFSGLEVELGKRIAQKLGVDVHFVAVASATRTELLDQGLLDLVMGTMTITPARQEQWDFSAPYFSDHASVLVESAEIKSLSDLVGKNIAVTVKTNSALALTQELIAQGIIPADDFNPATFEAKTWTNGIAFKEYDTPELANAALERGVVAGFCNDRSQLSVFLNDARHLLPESFAPQPFGIATPKGSDLSPFVAKVVTELIESGELRQMTEDLGLGDKPQ